MVLIPKKRPLDLVAAAKLRPTVAGRPMHLLFAGDGQLGPAIAAALSSLDGATGTITGFLNQTEIPSAFAVADCLVLPSDYGETWGLVVNEALASGLPVVVSDHCGCAEDLGLRQGQAHVYPCGDPGALAASLEQIASAPPAAELLRSIVDGQAPRHTAQTVRRLLETQGVCDG